MKRKNWLLKKLIVDSFPLANFEAIVLSQDVFSGAATGPVGVKLSKGAVLGMMIKSSSLREELLMLLRTIASIAASVIIGIACVATVSTDTFAAPAGTTRLTSCGPGMIRINGVCVDRATVHRKCERWRHGACVHYRYY